jgi:hypothetical protein
MTGDIRILRQNDVDNGIVSASTSISSLPASNVKDADIQKIWRATASTAHLIVDVGSVLTLGCVAAITCNGTANDTFQVRASTSDATVTSSLSYDSGSVSGPNPVYGQFVHFLPSAVSYQYVRLDMTQTTPPEVGRLIAGPVWTPSRQMSLVTPPESTWRDPSRRTYSIGQNIYIDALAPQRGYRFTLRDLTDAEKLAEVDELNRLRAMQRDVLICIDDESSEIGRDTIWGLLEQMVRAERMAGATNSWNVDIEIYGRL